MQKAIIIDLDDTLICTHKRHYMVFSNFIRKYAVPAISFEDYLKKRKTQKLSNKLLLKSILPQQIEAFEKFWLENIESAEYLENDELLADVELLSKIKQKGIALVILSLRSNYSTAIKQARSLPFSHLVDEFIFVKHAADINPKTNYINSLKNKYNIIAFIGDTESDKQAADEAGVSFFAVATGLYTVQHKKVFASFNDALKAITQNI